MTTAQCMTVGCTLPAAKACLSMRSMPAAGAALGLWVQLLTHCVCCAARRQAQEILAAQGLDKGGRDESLAPSDASEQMHVELIEGGPVLSMRITRSQQLQR